MMSKDQKLNSEDKIDIIEILKNKPKVLIGRSLDCDIVLHSNYISRKHAEISRNSNGDYIIRDNNSTNGTFVNGQKIIGDFKITNSDKIFIGKKQLSLVGNVKDLSKESAVITTGIQKIFKKNGKIEKVLQKIDLEVHSKSLLAIMGPSGCGKTTLLKTLNGEEPAEYGEVYLFGLELKSNYEYLKTLIGYVPQYDSIHTQLTVRESLYFTAKMRLDNYSDFQINKKIDSLLEELGVKEKSEDLISSLSGGQKKRVCIAQELLSEPLILFLDEPTSPLDPATIESFLNILKRLSNRGTTIIMVSHKPSDLDYMDEVLFLAKGGFPIYLGDSKKYKKYFDVDTALAVYSLISDSKWIDQYSNPRPITNLPKYKKHKIIKNNKPFSEQYYWLTKRYFKIKTNDKTNTAVMLLQAPIIAVLIWIVFDNITPAVPFITALSAIWFGTNNAAREIVSELPIFKRERMFNMDIGPYILSKITVLAFFSVVQSAIFILILYIKFKDGVTLNFNSPIYAFFWMSFLSIAATFLGLLLSASLSTSEKVMSIVPIVLIPQIMLAGLVAKINNWLVELISYLTFTRWGTEGFNFIQDKIYIEEIRKKKRAVEHLHENFLEKYTDLDYSGQIGLDIIAIILLTLIMGYFIYTQLKKKIKVL